MGSPRCRIGIDAQPIASVEWIDRESIRPNDYNPNHQAPPEHRLLETSILADGWTSAIVVHRESMRIVEGEHRWKVSGRESVSSMTGGKVPAVFVEGSMPELVMSTIRHNRARGQHGVLVMATLVRDLLAQGYSPADLRRLLEMDPEEVERLAEAAPLPEVQGSRRVEAFNKAWIPADRQKARP